MDIIIQHHSLEYTESENYIRKIVTLKDLPDRLLVHCNNTPIDFLVISDVHYTLGVTKVPGRIDYEEYLETIHILTKEECILYTKPYSLVTGRGGSVTLWEYGERERATLEEVGELAIA